MKGRSLTLSLIFASALLGSSVVYHLRGGLERVGLAWPLAFVLSFMCVGFLVKFERRLPISDCVRRRLSWLLIGAALILTFAFNRYQKTYESKYPAPEIDETRLSPIDPRRRGPPGKH